MPVRQEELDLGQGPLTPAAGGGVLITDAIDDGQSKLLYGVDAAVGNDRDERHSLGEEIIGSPESFSSRGLDNLQYSVGLARLGLNNEHDLLLVWKEPSSRAPVPFFTARMRPESWRLTPRDGTGDPLPALSSSAVSYATHKE
jgi:hypothetical protein